MKKTLSLILALLMSASCAATIFADEAEATSVITEDAPADTEVEAPVGEEATEYDLAVQFLVHKKIMQGKGETEDGELILGVKDDVKRYEMAVFAGRIATGWTKSTDWENGEDDRTEFTDLEGSGAKDSYGILSYVAEKNIIKGYPDGSFKPEATVTYRDALAIVVRTLGYNPDYPWGIIEKAVTLGLTEGITGVAYTDPINRGVAAQIMYNALFNATTAKGGNLAMDSFGVEYGWENILVTATDVATYEIGDKTTADTKGIVAFKLVEDNGELSDDVYYVHADITGDEVADLAFGKFYNALFEIDADEELVDMIGAIEYEAKVLKNAGNDITAEIATYMADYTIVDKYNVKNLSKDTLYNDEIIVVADATETVAIEWNNVSSYAINWETGDILKYDSAKKEYTTEWHYNEMYDLYFKWDADANIVDYEGKEYEIAGIKIMSEKELADLKDAIKASTVSKSVDFDGYKLYTGAFDSAYAALTVYDLDEDGMGDYAKYNTYKLGKYEGVKDEGDKDMCADCNNLKHYKFSGNGFTNNYRIAGTCDHYKAGNDTTYTLTEVTEGYTGWVIYDVDNAANTIEIIKEIPALGKNADEDSYVATGIVRGVDASGKYVVIGDEKFGFDYDKLEGTFYSKAGDNAKKYVSEFFKSMFNQFVEYVLVDGKIVKINTVGGTDENYIVVENYYGVDSDGYIVVAGYTTNDLVYNTFRIGAFDGWKTGSGFFYNEKQMEEYFEKGTVYQITSVDNTQKNGNVYYVTSITDVEDGEVVRLDGKYDIENAKVYVQDNYRITEYVDADGKTQYKTKRLADGQKYVIIGGPSVEFMPIYTFKGKIPDGNWKVNGDLLVANDDLYVFANVTYIEGFNSDTTDTGYVVLLGDFIKNVTFDGYDSEYYVYGATKYTVEAFNLLSGKVDDYAAATNLDLDAKEIYNTIGKTIVDDNGKKWADFWTNAQKAYADYDNSMRDENGLDDVNYIFAKLTVTADDVASKAAVSKNIISDLLLLAGDYEDLLSADPTIKTLKTKNGYIDSIAGFKWADDVKKDYVDAYVIYNAKAETVVIYVDVASAKDYVKPTESTVDASNKLVVPGVDNAYITATANVKSVVTNNVVSGYEISGVTFAFDGKATTDTHKAIDSLDLHFGEAGVCTIEEWALLIDASNFNKDGAAVASDRIYGSIEAGCYGDDDKDHDDDCDLIKKVAIKFETPVTVKTDAWTQIQVKFDTNELVDDNYDGDFAHETDGFRLTLCTIFENGTLKFAFDTTNGVNNWYVGATSTTNALTAVAK